MFRKSSLALALAAIALCSLSQSVQAQVSRVPNSGCLPGPVAYPTPVGVPRIGTVFGVRCPPCPPGTRGFIALGVTAHPPVVFTAPLACPPQRRCTLVVHPVVVEFPATAWRIDIPDDRGLIGACLTIQCGCFNATRPGCITLSGALRACVTR